MLDKAIAQKNPTAFDFVKANMFGLSQLNADSAKAVDAYQLHRAKEREMISKADALASLPKEQQKAVTAATNESEAFGLSAKQALGMAASWDALLPSAGTGAQIGEKWKSVRGAEDLTSELRKVFAQFKQSAQKEMLKGQGSVSNYERQLFENSAPTEFTNPEVVSSFLRKYAATQNVKKELKQAEVDWIQNNGSAGAKAKTDQEVGGFIVPAGTRFADVSDSIMSNLPTIGDDIEKALKKKGLKEDQIKTALNVYKAAIPQPKLKPAMPLDSVGFDSNPVPAPAPKPQSDLPTGEGAVNPEALIGGSQDNIRQQAVMELRRRGVIK
jgi:hypothetical protein